MNLTASPNFNKIEEMKPGKGFPLLTHPKIESLKNQVEILDFGAALQAVLAGETDGLHVLAGFFSHRSLPATCENNFTTDALIAGELLEHSCWQKEPRAMFSLGYGELRSVQSAFAIQSFYWLCRWYQNHETTAIAQNFLIKSFSDIGSRPENVSAILEKLIDLPAFSQWFSANAGQESQDVFNEIKKKNQGIEGALGASSRLFALFCLRHADVRWGGDGINGLFHPKVYVVERGIPGNDSFILMGSGNWSNSAFHATEETGNVEIGLALKLPQLIWQNLDAADKNDTGVRLVQTSRVVFAGCTPIASFAGDVADEKNMLKATAIKKDSDSMPGQFSFEPVVEEASDYLKALALLKNFVADKIGYQNLSGILEGIAPYQEEGAARLVAMLERDRGAILADSTGLGKTWVAMRVIAHYAVLMPELRVALVVPNQTVLQWQSEIARCDLTRSGCKINVIGHGFLQKKEFCNDHLKLLESNLVIIDESHNFRNAGSNRVGLLRSLLRLNYPENDGRLRPRRTLLLTATPINNRLEDLHTQLGMFRISPRDMKIIDNEFAVYLEQKIEAQSLLKRIFNRSGKTGFDPIKLCTDGWAEININDAEKYFHEEEEKLEMINESDELQHRRILDSLLNRLVVKRNRSQCQLIDEKSGLKQLFFRQPAKQPEKVQIQSPREAQLLIKLLRMFRGGDNEDGLKFAVHRWNLLGHEDSGARRENLESFQKFLFLKRLESSSMSLLQTLVRLAGLHALRVKEALDRCFLSREEINTLLHEKSHIENLAAFWAVTDFNDAADFVAKLAENYTKHKPSADKAEDEDAVQAELDFANEDLDNARKSLSLLVLNDFARLAAIITELAFIILGSQKEKWPLGLPFSGQIKWPAAESWAEMACLDAKLKSLFTVISRQAEQGRRVIIYSQFADSLEYIFSVVKALVSIKDAHQFARICEQLQVKPDSFLRVLQRTQLVSSRTDDADTDAILKSFAPYYHHALSPFPPRENVEKWEKDWVAAAQNAVEVLLATDVMAEGVNLQDVAALINFDLHWNPVRMIQRAGRIDRRLKPEIENASDYPELRRIARKYDVKVPAYYWKGRSYQAPAYINMILPAELEEELHLCLRLARKALTIKGTVGLDRQLGLPGDDLDRLIEFKAMHPDDFEPIQGAVDNLSILLSRANQLLKQAPQIPTPADENMLIYRHPEARLEDPWLINMQSEFVGLHEFSGILKRPLYFAGFGLAARARIGKEIIVEFDGFERTIGAEVNDFEPEMFLQKIEDNEMNVILERFLEEVCDWFSVSSEEAQKYARQLVWYGICRLLDYDENKLVNEKEKINIKRFWALNIPGSWLKQD